MLDTSDLDFPPSRVACGLLMHSLVAVRLLPLRMLQLPCVEGMAWEMLFAAGRSEVSGAALSCMLAPGCLAVFVQQVQASAGADFAMLTQDSFRMATFMRDAFHALRAKHRAFQQQRLWHIDP